MYRLRPSKYTTGDVVIPLRLHDVGIPIPIHIGTIGIDLKVLIGTFIANLILDAIYTKPTGRRHRICGSLHLLVRSSADFSIGRRIIVGTSVESITPIQDIAIIWHSRVDE